MSSGVYRELQSATGVDFAVWCRLSPADPQKVFLATACNNTLAIYTVGTVPYSSQKFASPEVKAEDAAQLQLVRSYTLHGAVGSMNALTLPESAAITISGKPHLQALVLGFGDARVSVVVLDPYNNELKTVGLFNFEEGASPPGFFFSNFRPTATNDGISASGYTVVDSESRAIACVAYNNQIVVMPVRGSGEREGDYHAPSSISGAVKTAFEASDVETFTGTAQLADKIREQVLSSLVDAAARQDRQTLSVFSEPFLLDLHSVGDAGSREATVGGLSGSIRDVCFLEGYSTSPTLAILVERVPTSSARLGSLANTVTLAVITLDTKSRRPILLWRKDRLPHDALRLQPVPAKLGGVLVLTASAAMYFNQNKYIGLATNGFALSSVDVRGLYPLDTNVTHDKSAPHIAVALDGASSGFISDNICLVATRDGTQYLLHLMTVSGVTSDVHHLILEPTAVRSVPAYSLALLRAPTGLQKQISACLPFATTASASALVFYASRLGDSILSLMVASPFGDSFGDDDAALYEDGVSGRKRGRDELEGGTPSRSALHSLAIDSLLCVGPIADSTYGREGRVMRPDDDEPPISVPLTEIAIASGHDFSGAVTVGNRGLRPLVAAELRLSGCIGAWFISDADSSAQFLVLAMHTGATRVLATREGLVELGPAEHAFVASARTVGVARLTSDGHNAFVQAHDGGLRVLSTDGLTVVADIARGAAHSELPMSATIVAMDSSDRLAVLRLSDGSIRTSSLIDGKIVIKALDIPNRLPADAVTAACVFTAGLFGAVEMTSYIALCTRSGRLCLLDAQQGKVVFESSMVQSGRTVLTMVESRSAVDTGVSFPSSFIRDISVRMDPNVPGKIVLAMLTCFDEIYVYDFLWAGASHTHPISRAISAESGFDFDAKDGRTASSVDPTLAPLLNAIGDEAFRIVAAESARFVRVKSATPLATHSDVAEKMSPAARESLHQQYSAPRLVYFSDICGWSGWACMSSIPCWLLSYRGTTVTIPMGIPDVTGAAGSTAIPGDLLHTVNVITAFTPFHSSQCEFGFMWAHQGYVQFGQLPRPTWPSVPVEQDAVSRVHQRNSAMVPRKVSYGLLYSMDGSHCVGQAPHPVVQAITQSREVDVTEARFETLSFPEDYRVADIAPHNASVVWFRYPLYSTVHKVSYLEHTSTTSGEKNLRSWHEHKAAAAKAAGQSPPVPPTPGQIACCVQPFYAVITSTLRYRDHPADVAAMAAQLQAGGGEITQISFGDHVELTDVSAAANDSVVHAFVEAGLSLPAPFTKDFSVALYSGTDPEGASWQPVCEPFQLKPNEHALCVAEVLLVEDGIVKPTLLVGTGFVTPRGEDGVSEGRLLGFRILPTKAAEGEAAAAFPYMLQQVYDIEQMAPVSCVAPLVEDNARHVVIGLGKNIEMLECRKKERQTEYTLRKIGFQEVSTWVRDLKVSGPFILYGDIYGSVRFTKWRDVDHKAMHLARDQRLLDVSSIEMMILEKSLGFVMLDEEGNIYILNYEPRESGTRLVDKANFHLGAQVHTTFRSRLAVPVGTPAANRRKFAVSFGTFDGAFGTLVPLHPAQADLLNSVQKVMSYCVPSVAGLNPYLWRSTKVTIPRGRPVLGNIIDASLVWQFLQLDEPLQQAIAVAAGTQVDKVMEALRYIDLSVISF